MDDRGPATESYPDIVPAERASAHLLALRRFWWMVLGAAALTASLAYVLISSQVKLYDASAKVLLSNAEPANLLQHSTAASSPDPERALNTELALVKLDAVARRVRAQLRMPASVSTLQVLRGLRVAPQGTSNLVSITDRDRSPVLAAAIANAFARQYVILRRQEAQAAYRTAAQQAQLQLARLGREERQGAHGLALRQQLRQLEIAGALQTGGAQFVDRATVPTTPASPRPKFAAAVGAFAGLLIGALLAIATGAAGAADRRMAAAAAGTHSTNGRAEVAASDVAAAEVLGDERTQHLPPSRAAAGEREP